MIESGEAALRETPAKLTQMQIKTTEREISTRFAEHYQAPTLGVAAVRSLPDSLPLAALSLRADPIDGYALLVGRVWNRDDHWGVAKA